MKVIALRVIDSKRLYIDPDCGFKLLPRVEKLEVMVKAKKAVEYELRLT